MLFPSMSLSRRICFLSILATSAVVFAGAQSSPYTSHSSWGPTAGESSSASVAEVAANGEGASAFAAPAADGFGRGAAQQDDNGQSRRHGLFNNLAFEAGGGFNAPYANDTSFITWGGNFTAGAGVHMSKYFSMLAEYQFMDDKLPGAFIAAVGTQGGHAHIWSATLDPVLDFFPNSKHSIYLTGGGGFYRKVTSFTDPQEGLVCTYYCGVIVQNTTVYHFSSNQAGMNVGLGLTNNFGGRNSGNNAKLFAEARYTYIDTPRITATNGTGTTELIPVTIGVRW